MVNFRKAEPLTALDSRNQSPKPESFFPCTVCVLSGFAGTYLKSQSRAVDLRGIPHSRVSHIGVMNEGPSIEGSAAHGQEFCEEAEAFDGGGVVVFKP